MIIIINQIRWKEGLSLSTLLYIGHGVAVHYQSSVSKEVAQESSALTLMPRAVVPPFGLKLRLGIWFMPFLTIFSEPNVCSASVFSFISKAFMMTFILPSCAFGKV